MIFGKAIQEESRVKSIEEDPAIPGTGFSLGEFFSLDINSDNFSFVHRTTWWFPEPSYNEVYFIENKWLMNKIIRNINDDPISKYEENEAPSCSYNRYSERTVDVLKNFEADLCMKNISVKKICTARVADIGGYRVCAFGDYIEVYWDADTPLEGKDHLAITQEEIRSIQKDLEQLGYDPGPIDGVWGQKTRAALENFQRAKGLTLGVLDEATLRALRVR